MKKVGPIWGAPLPGSATVYVGRMDDFLYLIACTLDAVADAGFSVGAGAHP